MTADGSSSPADLLARLDAVEARLARLVATPTAGLTEPDAGTGERWEAGQVWAHIAEFVPYWLGELQRVAAGSGSPDPVPYGRTKTDPRRIAAIERDRREDPRALLRRTTDGIVRVRMFMRELPADRWTSMGLHPTRGEVRVSVILRDSLVGHLEEHADQLAGLAGHAEGGTTG